MNIATCFQFRGDVEPSEVVKSLGSISSELKFSEYVPRAINSSVWNEPVVDFENFIAPKKSVHMLTVSSRTIENFDRISYEFDNTYSKRAYVHWLVGEGLESGEMSEWRENMAALIKDYEDVANYFIGDEIDGEDDTASEA